MHGKLSNVLGCFPTQSCLSFFSLYNIYYHHSNLYLYLCDQLPQNIATSTINSQVTFIFFLKFLHQRVRHSLKLRRNNLLYHSLPSKIYQCIDMSDYHQIDCITIANGASKLRSSGTPLSHNGRHGLLLLSYRTTSPSSPTTKEFVSLVRKLKKTDGRMKRRLKIEIFVHYYLETIDSTNLAIMIHNLRWYIPFLFRSMHTNKSEKPFFVNKLWWVENSVFQ